jgi:hypothetical protein
MTHRNTAVSLETHWSTTHPDRSLRHLDGSGPNVTSPSQRCDRHVLDN